MDGCDESIWDADFDGYIPISRDELEGRSCYACDHAYTVVNRIIEDTGDGRYYEEAIGAFDDYEYLENSKPQASDIDISTYQYARIVGREIGMREKQRLQQQPKNQAG